MRCSIDGCLKPVLARGWCPTHYFRWKVHGTPDLECQSCGSKISGRACGPNCRECRAANKKRRIADYKKRPDVAAKRAEHKRRAAQRPENRDRHRKYDQEYRNRPEVRERRRKQLRIRTKWRRALTRGVVAEKFDPDDVFERDNWQCQICGRRTLKSKRGTAHTRAPELDHIVPLSAGGEHTIRNTQCACRSCNLEKGARYQTRLVA